jgi:hypothetical protein
MIKKPEHHRRGEDLMTRSGSRVRSNNTALIRSVQAEKISLINISSAVKPEGSHNFSYNRNLENESSAVSLNATARKSHKISGTTSANYSKGGTVSAFRY